ncbi:FMN-linked oxidoreductase [Stereum hirsutum FP-91666 SS1]|uniref:FMN-linked oxidoreductase n=1 Tax=Stereum hirsutum (strain FP-91666) TaxID=721885 RepID=UPI000440FE13|nr:FMN-linked oxidoreductase [Stereum hirsutum FP-91666 SS1]EIM86683.1 FMN-linked oxidoreductase [Stereum hirsutum FP-91666 SS1]
MLANTMSKLFQPIQLGNMKLQHRIVLAPLTRFRNTAQGVPLDISTEYYTQRASTPGTFLISEGTWIAPRAGGWEHVPGITTNEQINAWKKIVDSVHAKGSFIYLQLGTAGAYAFPDIITAQGFPFVSSGSIPLPNREGPSPRPLTIPEIQEYFELYATAARTAVEVAGFDGVEIHGAVGLIDQFLKSDMNNRTDEYGGDVEGRCKFALEVVDAIAKTVGPRKVGLRIAPWMSHYGIPSSDVVSTFEHLVTSVKEKYPDLAYLHVIEPRVQPSAGEIVIKPTIESNDFVRDIWGAESYIAAGGFNREEAIETADKKGGLVALGRFFIANPDLPRRFRENLPLNKYDRSTFYVPGESPAGYIDYPFYEQNEGISA